MLSFSIERSYGLPMLQYVNHVSLFSKYIMLFLFSSGTLESIHSENHLNQKS